MADSSLHNRLNRSRYSQNYIATLDPNPLVLQWYKTLQAAGIEVEIGLLAAEAKN